MTNASKFIATIALAACANSLFAHEGHGLAGSHWHATDVWGLAVGVALVAAAWWLRGRK